MRWHRLFRTTCTKYIYLQKFLSDLLGARFPLYQLFLAALRDFVTRKMYMEIKCWFSKLKASYLEALVNTFYISSADLLYGSKLEVMQCCDERCDYSTRRIPGIAFIRQLWKCWDSLDYRVGCPRVLVRHPGRELKEKAMSEVCAAAVSLISGTLGILKIIQIWLSVWHFLLVQPHTIS